MRPNIRNAAVAFWMITSKNPLGPARSRPRRRLRSRPCLEDLEGRALLAAGSIQFALAAYLVADNAGTVKISLTRTSGADATAVTFATSDGTAVSGTDYTPVSGTISFPANAKTESVSLTVMPEAIADAPGRTVNLTLSGPTAGATLGSPSTAVLTITHVAAPGDLDGSFGPYGNGQVSVLSPPINANGSGSGANISVAEPDGSSYFVGSNNGPYILYLNKLRADGTLDPTFGQGGSSQVVVDPPSNYLRTIRPNEIVVKPDGKIVVTGSNFVYSPTQSVTSMIMVRFNINGTPDTSFGTNGVVIDTPLSPANGEDSVGAVVLSNGNILQVGNSSTSSNPTVMILRMHNPDGSLDLNFGNAGTVTVPNVQAEQVALQNGKILIGSSTGSVVDGSGELLIYRYNADGTLDTTFGTAGTASTPADFGGPLPGHLPDGSFIAASVGAGGPGSVYKFIANGQLDTTFAGGDGVSVAPGPSSMALQPDGKILVFGASPTAVAMGAGGYAVTRIDPDGTVDATFRLGRQCRGEQQPRRRQRESHR